MYRHNAEYDYAYCCISSVNVLGHGNARLNNCPLVEVPTPHGRLVDADETKEALRRAEALTRAFGYHNVIQTVSEVPTIIEAEEGEEE